jgi:DNA (cytosine-5)-methyltransferase 1
VNLVTGCSGIDAIAYAALLLDIDVIGQIEIDKFCNQILKLRFPGVKRYKDVFDVRGDEFGTVDIFAFGDPCQPHSVAGKRQGTADDRFIWPELFRIIQTMRPTWIINENVVGSVSNGVVRDKILQLESEGYRTKAYTVPACAVGAPHERQRVFIVAHAAVSQWESRTEKQRVLREVYSNKREFNNINRPSETCMDGYCGIETMADTERELFNRSRNTRKRWNGYSNSSSDVADTEREQAGRIQQRCLSPNISTGDNKRTKATCRPTQSRLGGNVNGLSGRLHEPGGYEDGSGIYDAFEAIFTAALEQILWPAGYGAEQYDYEPPRVATGVKNRTNRLKALGNSIVWQQIFPFLLAIKLVEGQVRGWTQESKNYSERCKRFSQ